MGSQQHNAQCINNGVATVLDLAIIMFAPRFESVSVELLKIINTCEDYVIGYFFRLYVSVIFVLCPMHVLFQEVIEMGVHDGDKRMLGINYSLVGNGLTL